MAKLVKHQNPAEMLGDDNPEWTAEDFSKARPASEVLPEIFPKAIADAMLKRGRPRKYMGFSDIIAREAETLSPEKQAEILDFIAFPSRTSRNQNRRMGGAIAIPIIFRH